MDIRLPSLGEGADSGVVVNILVKAGDAIQKDQPILELETEKAVGSIPAPVAGTVQAIRVKVGDKISAGQVIMTLAGTSSGVAPTPVPVAAPVPVAMPVGVTSVPGIPAAASPTVRKLARDLGIDLNRVRGSEAGGRISVGDLRLYIQQLQQLAIQPAAASSSVPVPAVSIDFAQWGPVVKKPLSPLRQTIARRMSESWNAVPRVTQFDEADITALNDLRKKYAKAYEAKGARLTLTGFVLKAVVATLRKHPLLNASLDEVANELVIKEYFHIGVAVDTEHGLIVPVIRDVDKKSVLDLSRELETLAGKARERKVSGEELKGGTFTISNQGGIGGGHFTPIVNKPEVAILGLGRGALKPVVREDKIVSRLMLPVALSYDHRVIDGGSAARFTVDLVQAFENFAEADVRI